MADKQKFPDALHEMVTRDGKTLRQIADHIGVHPAELERTYDLTGVMFPPEPPEPPEATA